MERKTKAWTITLAGALFFFYSFFQINMMNSLSVPLSLEFQISSGTLSLIYALTFWCNVIFLLPAGLLLDRISVKKILIANLMIAIVSTVLFAIATNIFMVGFARFILGIMVSFGLIACLKLASLYLPPNNMALASSLIVTIGMLGGIASQTPLMVAINHFGWRVALWMVAFLGLCILLILASIIKHPHKDLENLQTEKQAVFSSLFNVMKYPQNWLAGFFVAFLNFPVAIFGAGFGTLYLTQVYNFYPIQASSIVLMLFVGMIFGSPFFGFLSDKWKVRRLPMALGGIICLIVMLMVLYSHPLSAFVMYLLFFLIGFASGAQVLGYPVIAENNKPHLTGTALSLAAILIMGGGYGMGLPFVGEVLDAGFQGNWVQGLKVYPPEAFKVAFMSIPIAIILSLVAILFMKETRCKSTIK